MDTKGVKKIYPMTMFGYNGKGYQNASYTYTQYKIIVSYGLVPIV